jgi:outer membrane receptor for ferrienterochelin and colicin
MDQLEEDFKEAEKILNWFVSQSQRINHPSQEVIQSSIEAAIPCSPETVEEGNSLQSEEDEQSDSENNYQQDESSSDNSLVELGYSYDFDQAFNFSQSEGEKSTNESDNQKIAAYSPSNYQEMSRNNVSLLISIYL